MKARQDTAGTNQQPAKNNGVTHYQTCAQKAPIQICESIGADR